MTRTAQNAHADFGAAVDAFSSDVTSIAAMATAMLAIAGLL